MKNQNSFPPMPRRTFLAAASLGVVVEVGCSRTKPPIRTDAAINALSELARLSVSYPKADLYIRAAIELQALGKDLACEVLSSFAVNHGQTPPNSAPGLVVKGPVIAALCRMLFTQRAGSTFERARVGGGSFLGGTEYSDWPLEPIEIVDDVPFYIVGVYILGGWPQPAHEYVSYCIENCDWNSFKFTPKDRELKQAALDKLLSSPKWKQELSTYDKEFLSAQIQ